jgi:hypothetical protein
MELSVGSQKGPAIGASKGANWTRKARVTLLEGFRPNPFESYIRGKSLGYG